ncbi:bll4269 [Bradyrhizobium diazoefficiens USDA 110]|uniref:Bll4269 protein n=2 Tax=Bradyrhizobium diazoefficiens TaxID=1355477 RepID=Q89MC4_BRADU|nr:tyrosine-type recombinase/integrase [Bradyrhizobium diazoefficiens]AND89552.1 integrase [Bradyrhizobium diazoefficiens USDA 110]PDT61212.1 integrase [Bradyrhizobium diazoefficiens]QBP23035.1 integrase [Bradyrhizobium diazoefficiens]QLD44007.1 tyrosine-type recombinase/integrase [Bradyrhizobium diazoefficiens]WLA70301.1 tyrosine-type recombinase/integrase [Bradyrhizobium diazoefficiens]
MTRTRSIDPAERALEWRNKTLPTLGNFSELAAKPWGELREHEIFEGCRLGDEELVVPENWVPPTAVSRLSKRTVCPSDAGVPADPSAAERRDEAIRRALLALWLPRMTDTGVRKYKPGPWIDSANLLLRLAEWQFTNLPTEDGSVFGGFTITNILQEVLPALAPRKKGRDAMRALFRILVDAGIRGRISDWPRLYADGEFADGHDGPTIERNRHGRTAPAPVEKTEQRSWQPFSDSFVTEFIRRSLWVQNSLADQLIPLWAELRQIAASEAAQGRSSAHPSVIALRRSAIERVRWIDAKNQPITQLPFEVDHRDGRSNQWPPRSARDINRMVSTLQAMNFGMIDFCTGARASELAAAEDNENQGSDDRLHSVTFKLVDQIGGKKRDWPLHPAAVRAIELQQKICRVVRPAGQSHLWVILGDGEKLGKRLLNLTEPFVQAVDHLGLSGLTGRDRAHVHRWRHTVARLVALSVVGAPQVLLDLFGHRDLEMTLRYMLSDPRIIEDAMKVAKETSFVMAEEALAETIEGEAGGPAAMPLQAGLAAAGMRRGEEVFETATLRETAEVLTFNGRYWLMVRPGVICTKGLGQAGPCTRERGAPDPGACRTTCEHRLETTRAKQGCEETLRALIIERERADNDMVVANLDGQILANLERWDDVRSRVLNDHPEIQSIWEAGR